jgi:sugar phosphate isomerase/epimerase
MQLSCLPVSLFSEIISERMSLSEWAGLQAECGLDGLDMSISFIKARTPKYLNGLKNIIARKAVKPVMVTAYPDFTHPETSQREHEYLYFASDIAFCAEMRIPYLRVLAGQAHPSVSVKDGIRWAVDGIRRSAATADQLGVTLLFENHSKPGVWTYGDFSHPTEIFLDIMERIRDTSVRLNFDTANTLAYGDDPLKVLSAVIDRLETIHVADIAEKGAFHPVLVGTGVAPIGEVFEMAKANGFNTWACMEEASFTGIDGIRQAAVNTRRLWDVS